MDNKDLAKYLDHTNLNRRATRPEINKMVKDAVKYGFGGLCISSCWMSYVKNKLENLNVKDIEVVTVPNFVMGGGLDSMVGNADFCCEMCDEIDYIWNTYNFSELKAFDKTKKELEQVRKMTKGKLKVIIEAHYLRTSDEKIHKQGMKKVIKKACELVNESGAEFIKSDSGLFKRPDFEKLVEDCKLMVKYSKVPVKASGGISNRFQAETLIKLGIKRIGTSKAVEIITSTV